jgi:hypothetical protein
MSESKDEKPAPLRKVAVLRWYCPCGFIASGRSELSLRQAQCDHTDFHQRGKVQ